MTYEEHIKSLVGTTVKTRDGRDAKIVDVDFKAPKDEVILARIGHSAWAFAKNGGGIFADEHDDLDLILPPMPRERNTSTLFLDKRCGLLSIFNGRCREEIRFTFEKNPDTGKWEQVNP